MKITPHQRSRRNHTKPIKLEPEIAAMLDVALDALKERRIEDAWCMFDQLDELDEDWVFAIPGRSPSNSLHVTFRTFTNEQRVKHIICAMLYLAITEANVYASHQRHVRAALSDGFDAHREHIDQWLMYGMQDLGLADAYAPRGHPMTLEEDFAPADVRREQRRRKWLASSAQQP